MKKSISKITIEIRVDWETKKLLSMEIDADVPKGMAKDRGKGYIQYFISRAMLPLTMQNIKEINKIAQEVEVFSTKTEKTKSLKKKLQE